MIFLDKQTQYNRYRPAWTMKIIMRSITFSRLRAGSTRFLMGNLLFALLWASLWAESPLLAQSDRQEPSPPVQQDDLPTYVVQAGDTWLGIAGQFGVPVEVLLILNDLEDDQGFLFIGQQLFLPQFVQQSEANLGCAPVHVVQEGDTLWALAVEHETSVNVLRNLNNLAAGAYIHIGQQICVPSPRSENLSDVPIASSESSKTADLLVFEPGWVIQSPKPFWYTVNLGDTLPWVAARYGITPDEIVSANDLLDGKTLYPGQLLLIPTKTELNKLAWTARYWATPDLSGEPVLTRTEKAIAHNWTNGSPADNLPEDSFSAEWTGEFEFATGTYRFIALADQGMRLHLDDVLILDNWDSGSQGQHIADRAITSGTHTVRVEFWDETGPAMAYVFWFVLSFEVPDN